MTLPSTDLQSDVLDGVGHEIGRGPQALASADTVDEIVKQRLPIRCMGYFRVELYAQHPSIVARGCDRRVLGMG